MPQRVTDEDVKCIVTTSRNTQPYIVGASLLVDNTLVGVGLPDPVLGEIEKYLAAHFLSMDERRESEMTAGPVRAKFDGKTGMGLDSTMFGQTAKLLDTTGTLANIGMKKAEFLVF